MMSATPTAASSRAPLAIAMATRRSIRSTIMPLGTLNSSHGT